MRQAVHRRLWEVLTASPVGGDKRHAHLSPSADRRAMLEILRATKTDLPSVFASTTAAR
ncbi:MAG: hypothetical protein U0P30_15335 [Vicinamibacterales bacterium]